MSAMFMPKKRTSKGRGRTLERPAQAKGREGNSTPQRSQLQPEIPPDAITSFQGSLGGPSPRLAHKRAYVLRSSVSSATLVRRITADIEVLVSRSSLANQAEAVPEPPEPHPPYYKCRLLAEAPLTLMRARWDQPHLSYAVWFQRQLATLRLAEIGTAIASRLELLAQQQPHLVKSVAQHCTEWPVNLCLNKADIKGKRKLLRSKTAKKYLSEIQLNSYSFSPADVSPFRVSSEKCSPARVAAEQVAAHMRLLRATIEFWLPCRSLRKGRQGIEGVKACEWVASLMALNDPISKSNVYQWWAVARSWLDESWTMNPDAFRPLIKPCDARFRDELGENYWPKSAKNPIINNHIKKAFLSLAIR